MIRSIGFGASLLALTATADAASVEARYSLRLIGLSLGSATLTGSIEPASYEMSATAKLGGIATLVSNARGAANASGIFAPGRIAPNAYATTSANSRMTRTVRMALNAGNVRATEVTPPYEELPGRIPVTDADRRNVVDPISALLMPIGPGQSATGPAACNRVLPVYDGWARFDVALSYVGTRQVSVRGYTGPVSVCAARYRPIAGHRPDREGTKFMANNRNMEVWLAPVADGQAVIPFRISVATQIGALVIEAAEFTTTSSKASLH